ncbi:MAG: sigma 54-interacting transcriptional regulator [Myxococcales bacterium]|nr:sigma 54-interacting transcriptional regulator [Myxococcales bacterium]MCB9543177.1 sigma 54-interacting transcriptional regulator [Myxococcales bacterium]
MTRPPETGPQALATARRVLGAYPARLARARAFIEHLDGAAGHAAPDAFLGPHALDAVAAAVGGFVDPSAPDPALLVDAAGRPLTWPRGAPVPDPSPPDALVATPFGPALVVAAGPARLVLQPAAGAGFDEGERALAVVIARLSAPCIEQSRARDPDERRRARDDERLLHGLRLRGDLPGDLVAEDPSFRAVLARVIRLARAGLPVTLHGPTGVGKEVLARIHHHAGARRGGPLIAVNCAALPPELAEAHLFGHVRGAFTGAHGEAAGYLESATDGVLFLDELGELPLAVQAKLLRALDGWTRRVGETGPERAIELCVTAATHRDLDDERRLRRDLLHRLGTIVRVPPLCDRPADVLALARRALRAEARRRGLAIDGLAPCAALSLTTRPLCGNARELTRLVREAIAIGVDPDDEHLTAAHLAPAPLPAPAPGDDEARDLATRLAAHEARLVAGAIARHASIAAAARAVGDRDQTFRKRIARLAREGWLTSDGALTRAPTAAAMAAH